MLTTLKIKDETISGATMPDYFLTLDFPSNRISAREIIERRVCEEVKNYNSTQPEFFRGLVQPTDSERFLNGFKVKDKKRIDWREQYQKGCEAFERNGFILLVDDFQIEDLDQIIEIEANTLVTFLKLVPLVGG